MLQIRRLPQLVVAEVDGLATAAGAQLASQCDLAVASEDEAKFQFPGVNLGGFCTTPSVPASRMMPSKRMLGMLAAADIVSASQAYNSGLISHLCPSKTSLEEFTVALAKSIGARAPYGTFVGKWAFWKQLEMKSLEEAYDFAGEVMATVRELPDSQIGVQAWREKKRPVWD
jgi:enoyl-CoA hydratase/carnithine racemase